MEFLYQSINRLEKLANKEKSFAIQKILVKCFYLYLLAVYIKKTNRFKLLPLEILGFLCISTFISAQALEVFEKKPNSVDTSYLESTGKLEDYILDTGDILNIKFIKTPELSNLFTVNEQGEIYFDRIKFTYVRGLTIRELKTLLEIRFKEFLIDPEINIRINKYKQIRVSLQGEIRRPGIVKFPALSAINFSIDNELANESIRSREGKDKKNIYYDSFGNENNDFSNSNVKRSGYFVTSISNAILKAGGLTSYSNISKLEIIRDVPIGKGGGKQKAIIDFTPYLQGLDSDVDIRLFDGDMIIIPKLEKPDPRIIPLSVLAGVSPEYIKVSVTGRIENPGTVRIPLEGSLSDAMNLTGPRQPLAGKIFLIRYNKDGSLLRKNINYVPTSSPGSAENPYLKSGDLITVKNSAFGRSTGFIKAVTEPFVGIYATKEVVETITGSGL